MVSKGAGVALLCAVAVTVCGSIRAVAQKSARASSAETATSNAPVGTRSLPIFYDRPLAAQGFPNPLVKARIAGHEAIFIVDTGASANVLANWYAESAGIPSVRTDSLAKGLSGKTAGERLAHRVHGHWSDGQRFTLKEAVVVQFPPYFKSLHLGGGVSPQLLAPAGTAAVLDLRTPSLHFMPFARALSDLRRSRTPMAPPDQTQLCRNANTKLVNRVYLVPVTSTGITELMQVDTGATGTTFSERSKIAKAIESRSQVDKHLSEGVGGAVRERIIRGVRLLRGGRTVVVNPSIGKISPPCHATGNLGMDALRNCTLILGDREMALSCAPE